MTKTDETVVPMKNLKILAKAALYVATYMLGAFLVAEALGVQHKTLFVLGATMMWKTAPKERL